MKIKNVYDRDVKFWIAGAVMLSCIIQALEIFVTKSPIILELSDVQNEFHMDILTVNSIFCGFELTNLGILVSLTSDDAVKKLKGTEVSEDEIKDLEDELQKLTDKYIAQIEKAVEAKSKEVMTV